MKIVIGLKIHGRRQNTLSIYNGLEGLSFRLIILAYSLSRLLRRPGFPSAVRARRHVASSPLPSAQACPKRIEYAPKRRSHKGNDKGETKERAAGSEIRLLLLRRRHEGGRREKELPSGTQLLPPPSSSLPAPCAPTQTPRPSGCIPCGF